MRIVAFSDTHGQHDKLVVPDGDVLIFAGDMCQQSSLEDVQRFGAFLSLQPHKYKVVVAGNHDWPFIREPERAIDALGDVVYLQDSATTVEGSVIYGSPWQPAFRNWAFNLPRHGPELRAKWAAIPSATDILVTHGPPAGQCDRFGGIALGCSTLAETITQRVWPQLHIFGHIHSGYGAKNEWGAGTCFVNASICTETYAPTNKPVVLDYIKGMDVMPGGTMGEITDMILEGILCEQCGVYIDGEPPNHPQLCADCEVEESTE